MPACRGAILTAEAGLAGKRRPEDVTALINGRLNVMHYLTMLRSITPAMQS